MIDDWQDEDPLAPARGLFYGIVFGALLWLVIGGVVYVIWRIAR